MGSNLLPLSDVPPAGGSDLSSTGEQHQHPMQGRTLPEQSTWEVPVTHPSAPSCVNKRYSLMWNRQCGDSNFFFSFFLSPTEFSSIIKSLTQYVNKMFLYETKLDCSRKQQHVKHLEG